MYVSVASFREAYANWLTEEGSHHETNYYYSDCDLCIYGFSCSSDYTNRFLWGWGLPKLRTAQSTVQLVNPDLAQLEAAIRQNIKAKDNVEVASTFTELDRAEIELLETDLTKCVAAF